MRDEPHGGRGRAGGGDADATQRPAAGAARLDGSFGAAQEAAMRAAQEQAQKLRDLWSETRTRTRGAPVGSPLFARLADLAGAYAAMAARAGRRDSARAVAGDALVTLRDCCREQPHDVARHLAFSRTLELAAACEAAGGDARAAFDALRAAALAVARFAPMLGQASTPPLTRIALAEAIVRPMTAAANMLEESAQRRGALEQVWTQARGWAEAASGAADHAQAVEAAVVAALDLAVAEGTDSSGACLERCEELRPHLDALAQVRGEDAVVRTHRAAFARLCADAWARLGDDAEAAALLEQAQSHLDAAYELPDADRVQIARQRVALAAQRGEVEARRRSAATAPSAGASVAGAARRLS